MTHSSTHASAHSSSQSHKNVILRAEHLFLAYRNRQILNDVSLECRTGEITTIIGPNGCGKSTLMRILLGLQQADSGRVWRQKKLRIGYMPQRLRLDERLPLTVMGFLELAAAINKKQRRYVIDAWSARLEIRHLLDSSVHTLSGGEWQRVLLARALLSNPELLVMDEPVQGVDVQGQMELYQLIPTLRDELQCAVLMISHDLHLVMAATDEVICLNGHICCSGHPDRVSEDPLYHALFAQSATPIAHYTHHHDRCSGEHDHLHVEAPLEKSTRNQESTAHSKISRNQSEGQ